MAVVPIIEWFHGIDMIIDVFSMIVLLLLALNIYRFYKLKIKAGLIQTADVKSADFPKLVYEEKRYKLFIASFALLSISFLFKLFTYLVIQYTAIETADIGVMTITYQTVRSSDFTIFWGFFFFRVLSLLSFYLLYLAYTRKEMKLTPENPGKSGITLRNSFGMMFVLYLLLLAGYYSQSVFYVYYTTCFFLLFIITESVYEIYSVNRNFNTFLLAASFGTIMLSQGVFLFLKMYSVMYVLSEIIQLMGYLMLFITFFRITHPEKVSSEDSANILGRPQLTGSSGRSLRTRSARLAKSNISNRIRKSAAKTKVR